MREPCAGGREFICLDAMRTARSRFFDDLVAHAQKSVAKEPAIALLRSENAFQIAEFYFLAEEFHLDQPDRIATFIDRHNQDMTALLQSPETLRTQGLLPQRIRDALFTAEQKAKVVENTSGGRLRLDQSDIGRFLAPLISPETCRKTLVALADGGLLERKMIGQVIVVSTGVIEDYYRRHLHHVVDTIRSIE